MRRSASEAIRNLERRIARLEATSNKTSASMELWERADNIWGVVNGEGSLEDGITALKTFLKHLNNVGNPEQISETAKILKEFERRVANLRRKEMKLEELESDVMDDTKEAMFMIRNWADRDDDLWD